MRALRVVIAGFGPIYRAGLCSVLPTSGAEPGVTVVGVAGELRRARSQIRLLGPDVILTDMRFPDSSGEPLLASLTTLGDAHPEAELVVLTDVADAVVIRRAFSDGAAGYILRPVESADLRAALRTVADGSRYLDPRLGDLAPRSLELPAADLSQRELEVLQLLGLGHTNGEIAQRLVLSIRTVETHRSNIQRKLGIRTRADLARVALRQAGAAFARHSQTSSA